MNLTAEDRKALQDVMNVLTEILQQSPEVPDTIHEWPTKDKHLRGDFCKDKDGDIYRFSDGQWEEVWQPGTRQWVEVLQRLDNEWAPFTRTTDPSLPRTWDSLDAVDADVELVTGDYVGMHREFARSGVCESGWLLLRQDRYFGGWRELSVDRAKYVTNIRERKS